MSGTMKGPAHYVPEYPKFTPEMKSTHKILIPQMAPIHFEMIAGIFRQDGYTIEILENGGPEVAQEGLKYVHNDTCYPALLVIGQFIDALKTGKYDLGHTALMITQTGGGCRASNYIHLLRKALVKAGFPQIPVASLNFSGLERDSGFKFNVRMIRKAIAAVFYGDELMSLSNQIGPYENNKGEAMALVAKWQKKICDEFAAGRGMSKRHMKPIFEGIADDFAAVPVTKVPRVKVGVVGEIYVKYSPLGNNHIEDFLAAEGCEVNMPGLMGFIKYCIVNGSENIKIYGGSAAMKKIYEVVMNFTTTREKLMLEAISHHKNLHAPTLFDETRKLADGFIGYGAKMGEGWLLTAEMVELVKTGFENIVCAQPFGCLPNHVMGKGMISKIRAVYPQANITPIDYDPSATAVNQENRIKLMIAVAKERIDNSRAVEMPQPDEMPKAELQLG
jgi:predicted nucleotide-binding protein (sugar kinase/HSP70/actin superfamily)